MKLRFTLYCAALSLGLLASASSVVAQMTTFTNPMSIAINDNSTATPYPSTIAVSGLLSIMNINVRINSITHNFPDDVGILLVGPTGIAV